MTATAGGAVLAGIIGLGFIELTLTERAVHKREVRIQESAVNVTVPSDFWLLTSDSLFISRSD